MVLKVDTIDGKYVICMDKEKTSLWLYYSCSPDLAEWYRLGIKNRQQVLC